MEICFCGSSETGRAKVYSTRWGPVHIVHCLKCGLARDSLEHSYEYLYTDEAAIVTSPSETQYQKEVQRMDPYLRFLDAHIKEKGTALDIGCNAGFLLEAVQRRGWSATGLEINPSVASFAASRGLNVINERLEENSLYDDSFDLITMSHVLEHLPRLGDSLKQVFRLLKPGGYLFVAVPNYGSRVFRLIYKDRYCFLPGQHIWYFTKATLASVCKSASFVPRGGQTLVHMSPHSRIPFGSWVKRVLIWWMRIRDDGDEVLGLFQKPYPSS